MAEAPPSPSGGGSHASFKGLCTSRTGPSQRNPSASPSIIKALDFFFFFFSVYSLLPFFFFFLTWPWSSSSSSMRRTVAQTRVSHLSLSPPPSAEDEQDGDNFVQQFTGRFFYPPLPPLRLPSIPLMETWEGVLETFIWISYCRLSRFKQIE